MIWKSMPSGNDRMGGNRFSTIAFSSEVETVRVKKARQNKGVERRF
jgi:hypothetical protein